VTPGPVVEHFNVIEDICPSQIPGFVYSLPDAFIPAAGIAPGVRPEPPASGIRLMRRGQLSRILLRRALAPEDKNVEFVVSFL